MKSYFLFSLILFIFSFNLANAAIDSTAAVIDLDYLIGRIWCGIGAEMQYNFYSPEEMNYSSSYHSYQPLFAFGKENIINCSVTNFSREYDGQNWHYFPNLKINYRPHPSIQFYMENQFPIRDYAEEREDENYTYQSSIKYQDDYLIHFGLDYLSGDGQIDCPQSISKWIYYLMLPPDFENSDKRSNQMKWTSAFFDSHNIIVSDCTLPFIFVKPNQFYIKFRGDYNNSQANRENIRKPQPESTGDYYDDRTYNEHQVVNYRLEAYYLAVSRFYINQKIEIADQNSFYSQETRQTKSGAAEPDRFQKSTRTRNYGFYRYTANLNFFVKKNILNQIYYVYRNSDHDSYGISYRLIPEKDFIETVAETGQKKYDFGYLFHWLKVNNSIPVMRILSDYQDFYGHLLPKSAQKLTSGFFYQKINDISGTEYFENTQQRDHQVQNTAKRIAWRSALDYGIFDKLNFNFTLSLTRSTSPNQTLSEYYHGTSLGGCLGLSFYNFLYDASIMNWSSLGNFDYWQGPLFQRGMLMLQAQYIPPGYGYGWRSGKEDLLKFNFQKLHSSKFNRIALQARYGLINNLELEASTLISRYDRSDQTIVQAKLANINLKKTKYEYACDVALQWQFLKSTRLKLRYIKQLDNIEANEFAGKIFEVKVSTLF